MAGRHAEGWPRREFLGMTLAGTAGLLGLKPDPLAAEPPPETTALRLARNDFDLCQAPQYVAEQFLRDEGFTDVQYIKKDGIVWHERMLASGEADISMAFVPTSLIQLDAGSPIVILAGGHIGCIERLGSDRGGRSQEFRNADRGITDTRSFPFLVTALSPTRPTLLQGGTEERPTFSTLRGCPHTSPDNALR